MGSVREIRGIEPLISTKKDYSFLYVINEMPIDSTSTVPITPNEIRLSI